MKIPISQYGATLMLLWENKERKKLLEVIQVHNEVKQAMIGREVYYMTANCTTEPVVAMGFEIQGSGITIRDTSVNNKGESEIGYWVEWLASYTNQRPNTQLVLSVSLLNSRVASEGDNIYATAPANIQLQPGQVLDCYYKHTFSKQGIEIQNNLLEYMRDCFTDPIVSKPIKTFQTTLLKQGETIEIKTSPVVESGGGLNNTHTTWSSIVSNLSGDGELIKLQAGTLGLNTVYYINEARKIALIEVGNPATITTVSPHGFETGDTVNIRNSNSTPSIDGTHQITVINDTKFTIPVSVQSGGNQGDCYRAPLPLDWSLGQKVNERLTIEWQEVE